LQLINNFVTNLIARIQEAREESGQTLVEYGLIVALLSIAAIAILATVGGDIVDVFTEVSSELQNATTP
jgi:pilus assembly protein Flp/PilA